MSDYEKARDRLYVNYNHFNDYRETNGHLRVSRLDNAFTSHLILLVHFYTEWVRFNFSSHVALCSCCSRKYFIICRFTARISAVVERMQIKFATVIFVFTTYYFGYSLLDGSFFYFSISSGESDGDFLSFYRPRRFFWE